jgi:hypothetical protein
MEDLASVENGVVNTIVSFFQVKLNACVQDLEYEYESSWL